MVHGSLEPSTCPASAQTGPPEGHSAASRAEEPHGEGRALPDRGPLTHALFSHYSGLPPAQLMGSPAPATQRPKAYTMRLMFLLTLTVVKYTQHKAYYLNHF